VKGQKPGKGKKLAPATDEQQRQAGPTSDTAGRARMEGDAPCCMPWCVGLMGMTRAREHSYRRRGKLPTTCAAWPDDDSAREEKLPKDDSWGRLDFYQVIVPFPLPSFESLKHTKWNSRSLSLATHTRMRLEAFFNLRTHIRL
jgi:hypothetical protein